MRIEVTGKNIRVTEGLRRHVETQTEKLRRHFGDIIDLHVVLEVERGVHRAEGTLLGGHRRFHEAKRSRDMYQSIDRMFAGMDEQILRFRDRRMRKRARERRGGRGRRRPPAGRDRPRRGGPREISGHPEKPMGPREAVLELEFMGDPGVAFSTDGMRLHAGFAFRLDDGPCVLVQSRPGVLRRILGLAPQTPRWRLSRGSIRNGRAVLSGGRRLEPSVCTPDEATRSLGRAGFVFFRDASSGEHLVVFRNGGTTYLLRQP